MQVRNVLHTARWKCRTQKIAKNSPSGHHHSTLSGYIYAAKARINNGKKNLLNNNISPPHVLTIWRKIRPTSGWDLLASLGHPSKFQQVLHLGSVTARHSSNGHQPKCAALNRGHRLHSAGWPWCWALAHILVTYTICCDNLWKSVIMALEISGNFFLVLSGHPDEVYFGRKLETEHNFHTVF